LLAVFYFENDITHTRGSVMKKFRCSINVCLWVFLTLIGLMVLSSSALALQSGDFTYTVSGSTVTITKYNGTGGNVIIPGVINSMPVVGIGYQAFYDSSGLTSVTIPNSVTSIGYEAFQGCSGLTGVTIPGSVTSIEFGPFANCSGLTSIAVDASNTAYRSQDGVLYDIAKTVLVQYPGGKSGGFTIPDSVTSIGWQAFYISRGLTSVTIPDSVTSIGMWAFRWCTGLTSVTIPNSVTSIEWGAFQDCTHLTSVTIGSSVTSIGDGAFEDCSALTGVTIPDSVTSIGRSAFASCTGLTSVTIPGSVTSIGGWVFAYCYSLTSIAVDTGNNTYSSQDGVLYNKAKTVLVQYPGGKSGGFIIPDSVTSIDVAAFTGCTGLTSVTFPDSVTSIGNSAFYWCSSLTRAYFLGNAPSMGTGVFSYCAGSFSICYTAGAPGFTTPTWCPVGTSDCYRAAVCGPSTTTVPPTTTTTTAPATTTVPTPCQIMWSGSYTDYYGTHAVSGSAPTAETSRTEQAAQEVYSHLPDIGCEDTSPPNFTNSCYGSSFNQYTTWCTSIACIDGSWSMNWGCRGIPMCSHQYGSGHGNWDVVCSPTLILLSSFTTTPKAGKVIVKWDTESETNNAGFNLYRAEAENGKYTQINTSLIPAKGTSTQGASYEFTDNNVQNKKTYYYKLEDIDLNGTSTMHGSVSATPRLIFGIFGK
jgi:hypothetical protein